MFVGTRPAVAVLCGVAVTVNVVVRGAATTVVVDGGGTLVMMLVRMLVWMLVEVDVWVGAAVSAVSTAVPRPPRAPAPTSSPAAAQPASNPGPGGRNRDLAADGGRTGVPRGAASVGAEAGAAPARPVPASASAKLSQHG